MRLEIEVGAIGNAHQLVPMTFFLFTLGEEAILNVDGALGIVRQLFFRLFVQAQVFFRDANVLKPLMTSIDPFLMCLFVLARSHKVFHLHLLELARAENEITGRDFVAKRFADLRDAEREFAPAGVQDVEKIYEDALRGFGTKIDECFGIVFCRGTDVRTKHQVEGTHAGPIRLAAVGALRLSPFEKTPPSNQNVRTKLSRLQLTILFSKFVSSKPAL